MWSVSISCAFFSYLSLSFIRKGVKFLLHWCVGEICVNKCSFDPFFNDVDIEYWHFVKYNSFWDKLQDTSPHIEKYKIIFRDKITVVRKRSQLQYMFYLEKKTYLAIITLFIIIERYIKLYSEIKSQLWGKVAIMLNILYLEIQLYILKFRLNSS